MTTDWSKPFTYRLADGYAVSMPTLRGALESMAYELTAQEQPAASLEDFNRKIVGVIDLDGVRFKPDLAGLVTRYVWRKPEMTDAEIVAVLRYHPTIMAMRDDWLATGDELTKSKIGAVLAKVSTK